MWLGAEAATLPKREAGYLSNKLLVTQVRSTQGTFSTNNPPIRASSLASTSEQEKVRKIENLLYG
jgi:hypothetical protein